MKSAFTSFLFACAMVAVLSSTPVFAVDTVPDRDADLMTGVAEEPTWTEKLKQDASRAGEVIKEDAIKAGGAIKSGAVKTGEVIKMGASKTGDAAKRGYEKLSDYFADEEEVPQPEAADTIE